MSSRSPIFFSAPARPKPPKVEGLATPATMSRPAACGEKPKVALEPFRLERVWPGARGETFCPARSWMQLIESLRAVERVSSRSKSSPKSPARNSCGSERRVKTVAGVCARSARSSREAVTISNEARGLLFAPAGVWSGVKWSFSKVDREWSGCGGRLFRRRGDSTVGKEASFQTAETRNWHEGEHFSPGTGKNFPPAGSETGAPVGNWSGGTLNFEP